MKLQCTALRVPRMSHSEDEANIREVIGAMAGVSGIETSLSEKLVTVHHDNTVPREALSAQLAQVGYPPTDL